MIGVKVKDNESVDRAINRFKKMVTRSRILMEYRERQQFTKPSEERREALKKSVREERRRQRFNYWFFYRALAGFRRAYSYLIDTN